MMDERAVEKGKQAIDAMDKLRKDWEPVDGEIPIVGGTSSVAAKDPGKGHFYVSLAKSGLRIVGCLAFIALGIYANEPLFTFGSTLFLIAEILGVVEEVV